MPLVAHRTSISIKELHANTGEQVRQAGQSRRPVAVTDRGKVVAVLVGPSFLNQKKRLRRVLPKDYLALLGKTPITDVQEDLDAVRGER